MTLKDKAIEWFLEGVKDKEKFLRTGYISEENIVKYYLKRHPWEVEHEQETDKKVNSKALCHHLDKQSGVLHAD